MPPLPQKSVGTPGRILVVEEYRPLAVALTSAVKKFAPDWEMRIVASLAEADEILLAFRPDLLVLDFDPPFAGNVEFLRKMQAALPDSRALVLCAEVPPILSSEWAPPTALHFLEKPFELVQFGEALVHLLQPDHSLGTFRSLGLLDFIQLFVLNSATVILGIEAGAAHSGEIHFAEGRVVHAATPGSSGTDAFHSILRWRATRFVESERPSNAPHTLQSPWFVLVAEALRHSSAPPAPKTKIADKAAVARGKKIVVIDDSEEIAVFVEQILATSDPTLEVTVSLTASEGLRRVSELKPALVLLDFSLPDLNGDEVARRLLEDTATARIPIIMMSGYVAEIENAARRFSNIFNTIAKPFLSSALLDLVNRALSHSAGNPGPKLEAKQVLEVHEPHVVAAKKSTNGKSAPPALALPAPCSSPLPIEPEIQSLPDISEIFEGGIEQEETAPFSSPSLVPENRGIPAAIQSARSNSVVLGIPLEVITIEFSPALRIQKIRARPFSPAVAMRVLPQAIPGLPLSDTAFDLAAVKLERAGRIESVRLAPTAQPQSERRRFSAAIDGVVFEPSESGKSVIMIPTEVAPMRLQLMSLFELSSVELSPEFRVAHLVLSARDARTRVTLLPEVAQTGATFEITSVKLRTDETLAEICLQTLPA